MLATHVLTYEDPDSFNLFKTQDMYTQVNTNESPEKHEKTSQDNKEQVNDKNKKQVSKRSQVKNACVNCQKACKKCDAGRPCQRCIKLGITDTCVDSPRKERKKGFKRGPYRKKEKQNQLESTVEFHSKENLLSNSLITSQSLALCMQPADPTEITRLWEYKPNNSNSQMNNTPHLNFIVPSNNNQEMHLLDNTSTRSSTSSLKTVNHADSTRQNATPHISSNHFLPLYDNPLLALPKLENNIFISVNHQYDLNHYNDVGLDMTHSDVYLSDYTNQWIKTNTVDNQGFL